MFLYTVSLLYNIVSQANQYNFMIYIARLPRNLFQFLPFAFPPIVEAVIEVRFLSFF